MKMTEITLLIDMNKKCRNRIASFVAKVARRTSCNDISMRLVGCGMNKRTYRPLLTARHFLPISDELSRQVVELLQTPFADDRGGLSEGLRFVLSSIDGKRGISQVVFVVTDLPESSFMTELPLIEKLRSSGVLVRCISPEMPEAVVGVVRERGGGYVRVVERHGDMTILARYSCLYGPKEREFTDYVVGELLSFKPSIDVERFTRSVADGGWGWSIDHVQDLYGDVLWNNPQIFYVNKSNAIHWRGNRDSGAKWARITGYTYAIHESDHERCKAELDAAARMALSGISGVTDPVEKAKILHDFIVTNCEYDKRGIGNPKPEYRTAYDVLVRHGAVCEGYVMAYRYLLALAGIESEEVVSKKMKHCWSYLNLNDHWYHVDVTWDDPTFLGKPSDFVSHKYFLLSDAAIRGKEHFAWDVRGLPPADDTAYDNTRWSCYRAKGHK